MLRHYVPAETWQNSSLLKEHRKFVTQTWFSNKLFRTGREKSYLVSMRVKNSPFIIKFFFTLVSNVHHLKFKVEQKRLNKLSSVRSGIVWQTQVFNKSHGLYINNCKKYLSLQRWVAALIPLGPERPRRHRAQPVRRRRSSAWSSAPIKEANHLFCRLRSIGETAATKKDLCWYRCVYGKFNFTVGEFHDKKRIYLSTRHG